jgi:hypothetical protein
MLEEGRYPIQKARIYAFDRLAEATNNYCLIVLLPLTHRPLQPTLHFALVVCVCVCVLLLLLGVC